VNRPRVLVARLDSAGDVLLAGPAISALAADADVDVLTSHIGAPAARILPGVDDVLVFDAPWVLRDPPDLDAARLEQLVAVVRARRYRAAAILTSSHQSPLPLALLLRLAGLAEIAAVSLDHAGRLLDHRIAGDPDVHEVERGLLVAAALGATPPARPRLAVTAAAGVVPVVGRVVVHPGSAAPARTLAPARWGEVVAAARRRGLDVVVTGAEAERPLVMTVAAAGAEAVITTSLVALAEQLASAAVVACGNTGPMHLAAAVGRPVVVPWAPVVPAARWAPWGVRHVLLGDEGVPCAGCRSVSCPLDEQLCLQGVDSRAVVDGLLSMIPQLEVAP
jgi:heptosyltransferase III